MHALAFLIILVALLLLGGPTFVTRFTRGFFRGVDVYVFLTVDGKTMAYKNPLGRLGTEDQPLEMVPFEILSSNRFETYYNACWWECGALFRCQHSFHRTEENAGACELRVEGTVIGKVPEER